MEQITARALRDVEWKPVYTYAGSPNYTFTTYASDKLPGLTITKERRGLKRGRFTTIYKFNGRKTDSPTQAVRIWNEEAKRLKGGRCAPGSAKQTGPARGDAGL